MLPKFIEYNSIGSNTRITVTLLCLLVSSSIASSVTVYIDSYSVHKWNEWINVGPIALTVDTPVQENNLPNKVDDILALDGVSRACYVECMITNFATTFALDQEYFEVFPDVYTLVKGRFPENNSEIALYEFEAYKRGVDVGSFIDMEKGDRINITNLVVVGLYSCGVEPSGGQGIHHGYVEPDIYRAYAWAIMNKGVFSEDYIWDVIHIDIDRDRISPFNVQASLELTYKIETALREFDPNYSPDRPYSSFDVSNIIGAGIANYALWVSDERVRQLFRISGPILLLFFVVFISIRYNINERKSESNVLLARGATQHQIDVLIFKEILGLSIFATVFGLLFGIVVSRFGIASIGFMRFDLRLIFKEPILVTLESLILSFVVGIFLPIGGFAAYRALYTTQKRIEEEHSRLSKIVSVFSMMQWDIIVILLTLLFIYSLQMGGSAAVQHPLLIVPLILAPYAIFLGLASFSIKIIRRVGNPLARFFQKITGTVPANVGVRRISESASSAAPLAMVLVLAISLSFNNCIIDASVAETIESQARFGLGADVSFLLRNEAADEWPDFFYNITAHELVEEGTLVASAHLAISSIWDRSRFVAINPNEYARIGYDEYGVRLSESPHADLFVKLDETPNGAIITSDISATYDLFEGDILQAYDEYESVKTVISFTILGVVNAISNPVFLANHPEEPLQDLSGHIVGQESFWVNRKYLQAHINLTSEHPILAWNAFCIRTADNANGTKVVEYANKAGFAGLLEEGKGAAVLWYVENYLNDVEYRNDHAVDTIITLASLEVILISLMVYSFERIESRKRETALLRAMSADKKLIVKIQMSELLAIMLICILNIFIFTPPFIINSVYSINITAVNFPVKLILKIPWVQLWSISIFFTVSVIILISSISAALSRINLTSALNATWTESGPLRE